MVELPLARVGKADKGRRLDHVWVSPALAEAVKAMEVLRDARGWERPSDHAPVKVELDAVTRAPTARGPLTPPGSPGSTAPNRAPPSSARFQSPPASATRRFRRSCKCRLLRC